MSNSTPVVENNLIDKKALMIFSSDPASSEFKCLFVGRPDKGC